MGRRLFPARAVREQGDRGRGLTTLWPPELDSPTEDRPLECVPRLHWWWSSLHRTLVRARSFHPTLSSTDIAGAPLHTTGSDSGWQGAGPCLQLLLCPCLRPGPLRGPAAGLQAWRSRENLAPASWPHAPRFYLESGPLAGSQRQHWGEALGLGPVQVKQRQGRAEAGVCNAAELRGACGEGPGGLG